MVRYSLARDSQATASYTEAKTAVPACVSPDLIAHIWLSMHGEVTLISTTKSSCALDESCAACMHAVVAQQFEHKLHSCREHLTEKVEKRERSITFAIAYT